MQTRSDFTFENLDKDFTRQQLVPLASNVSFENKQSHTFFDKNGITDKGKAHLERLIKHNHKSPLFVPKLLIHNCPALNLIEFSKEEIAGIDYAKNENGLYDYTFSLYGALLLENDNRLPADIQHKLTVELVNNFDDIRTLWHNQKREKATAKEKAFYQRNTLKYYTFKVQIPFFLANEFKRHKIGTDFNEVSFRYSDGKKTYYFPKEYLENKLLPQAPEKKRQGRGEGFVNEECIMWTSKLNLDSITNITNAWYNANKNVIAPEVARNILPEATYTTLIMSMSVATASRICSLRLDKHAQKEAQIFAGQIKDFFLTVEPEFNKLIEIAGK